MRDPNPKLSELFEIEGYFWPIDQTLETGGIPGKLAFRPGDGIALNLLGVFTDASRQMALNGSSLFCVGSNGIMQPG
jgi:hypothetical protein